MRMVVIVTYRSVDPVPNPSLAEMVAEVVREPVTRRLSLGGLTRHEVERYVELTATAVDSAELGARLHEETEGNPLFVGEIVRLLSVEGTRPERGSGGPLAIPESVRDVISRRLGHLSEGCRRMLALASALGREFAVDALARLSGDSEDQLLEMLDEAMGARVVSDVPGAHGSLRFSHVLMRDTLYESLTSARRVQIHRLAVTALETLYGDEPGPHLAELAYHAIAGRDLDKGTGYARAAADRATTLLAYEEGARLYQTALDALDRTNRRQPELRCELLLSLGGAQARAGNRAAAKQAYLGAAEIARRGDPRQLARAALGYGGWYVWDRAGDDERLVPLLDEALRALHEDDVEHRAWLLARLAGALRDDPSRVRRDALSREAVDLARRSGDATVLAWALDSRVTAICAPDTIDECLALGAEPARSPSGVGTRSGSSWRRRSRGSPSVTSPGWRASSRP